MFPQKNLACKGLIQSCIEQKVYHFLNMSEIFFMLSLIYDDQEPTSSGDICGWFSHWVQKITLKLFDHVFELSV